MIQANGIHLFKKFLYSYFFFWENPFSILLRSFIIESILFLPSSFDFIRSQLSSASLQSYPAVNLIS